MSRLRQVPWEAVRAMTSALEPALAEVLDGAPAERVLDRLLRQHRAFTADERAVAAESLFGVGLWRRRLKATLGVVTPGPLILLASLLRDLAGVEQAAQWVGIELPPAREPASFADRHSLPDWLAQTIERELGPEADAFAQALNQPGPVCLRTNLARLDRHGLAERLRAEGVETRPGLAASALVVTSARPNLYGLTAWAEGLFEVQDDGSQLLGELVGVRPGDEVVDLCAGAGGKSLQLAALMGGKGRVHAFDADRERLERLRRRAERAHVDGIVIHDALPDGLRVDRVLVDAPCSELGALRRGPDLRWRLQPESFEALPDLQLQLLERGATHMRPDGRLVYATCTFRREENDEVVARFEHAHPDFERVTPEAPAGCVQADIFRTWPHRHGTDAFFAAVFRQGRGSTP